MKNQEIKNKIDVNLLKKTFQCPTCFNSSNIVTNTVIQCASCKKKYIINDTVVKIDNIEDEFYEGKYKGSIKFIPKEGSFLSKVILWIINSGYLWYTSKNSKKRDTILELGCGGGVSFFGSAYKTIGMDLSLSSMKDIGINYSYFLKSNIYNKLPLKSSSMDLVVSSFFWEHIELSEKENCLKEIHRVLKPNGKVVFLFDVETKNPLINYCKKKNAKKYNDLFIDGDKHIGYESILENNRRFKNQGFKITTLLGCEKTFFQSWSTFNKLSKFNNVSEFFYKLFSIRYLNFLYYPYTFFLRLVDETIGKILPINWSRTVLVVLDKKHD
jgi:ubiquinone/menaquinone biosynthesis C-methylase UbiE